MEKTKKAEFVKNIQYKAGISSWEAEQAFSAIVETFRSAISKGHSIEIRGFMSMKVGVRAERKGRNPQTGEAVVTPPKKKVYVKLAKEIKTAAALS